jgi:hypothetical protein
MSQRVVIDVDGVIADFTYGITQRMSKMDPSYKPVHSHQQPSWDFREAPKGLFVKAFAEVGPDAFNFNRNLQPLITVPDAHRLASLAEIEEVYFATNRPGGIEALRGTKDFLRSKIGISDPNVILTARKGDAAMTVGATHFIDDKAGNAVFAKYHSPNTKVFLLDALYNQFDQSVLGTKVLRAASFEEFLDVVYRDIALMAGAAGQGNGG